MSLLTQSLGMGRGMAEARMTETVTIGRFDDGHAADGSPTRVPVETYYTGKARVKLSSLAVSGSNATSQDVSAQKPYVSIPTGSPAIPKGAEVQVSASKVDPLLVGLMLEVEGRPQSGQTTSHRYPLKGLS